MNQHKKLIFGILLITIMLLPGFLFIYNNTQDGVNLKQQYTGQQIDIDFRYPDEWLVKESRNCNSPLSLEQNCVDISKGGYTIRIYSELCDMNCNDNISTGNMNMSEIGEYKIIEIDEYSFIRFGAATNKIPRADGKAVLGVPLVRTIQDKSVVYSPQALINDKLYVIMYLVPQEVLNSDINENVRIIEMDLVLSSIEF